MQKKLVITGGSKGIGKATIAYFQQQGWQAINLSRTSCDLAGVTNIKVDLAELGWENKIRQNLEENLSKAEKICLVHNAAFYNKDNIQQLSSDTLRKVLEVNIIAPSILNQLLLPKLNPGSSIIYVGSTLSEKAVPNSASYSTSKHALAGLMKASSQDLAGTGIHSCCICPGFTETEMVKKHLPDPKTLQAITKNVCAKRLVQPQEIASFIYYCADNPVINGAVLHANLGQIER